MSDSQGHRHANDLEAMRLPGVVSEVSPLGRPQTFAEMSQPSCPYFVANRNSIRLKVSRGNSRPKATPASLALALAHGSWTLGVRFRHAQLENIHASCSL